MHIKMRFFFSVKVSKILKKECWGDSDARALCCSAVGLSVVKETKQSLQEGSRLETAGKVFLEGLALEPGLGGGVGFKQREGEYGRQGTQLG